MADDKPANSIRIAIFPLGDHSTSTFYTTVHTFLKSLPGLFKTGNVFDNPPSFTEITVEGFPMPSGVLCTLIFAIWKEPGLRACHARFDLNDRSYLTMLDHSECFIGIHPPDQETDPLMLKTWSFGACLFRQWAGMFTSTQKSWSPYIVMYPTCDENSVERAKLNYEKIISNEVMSTAVSKVDHTTEPEPILFCTTMEFNQVQFFKLLNIFLARQQHLDNHKLGFQFPENSILGPVEPTKTLKSSGSGTPRSKNFGNSNESKVADTRGHKYVKVYFSHPTWCSICKEFLWGIASKQGYKCTACKCVAHSKCQSQGPTCTAMAANFDFLK